VTGSQNPAIAVASRVLTYYTSRGNGDTDSVLNGLLNAAQYCCVPLHAFEIKIVPFITLALIICYIYDILSINVKRIHFTHSLTHSDSFDISP